MNYSINVMWLNQEMRYFILKHSHYWILHIIENQCGRLTVSLAYVLGTYPVKYLYPS